MVRGEARAVLEARGLSRRYRLEDGRALAALSDVSLTVDAGEMLGVVGESGCGKSTLLRLLASLERPDAGTIWLHGEDVTRARGSALRERRRRVQMVFQDPALAFFPRMRAGEAVAEPLRNYAPELSAAERRGRVRELLGLVGLAPELAERLPHSMSGGQRQRLGIARALAAGPEVLLCDEVTSALDVSAQAQVVELLVRLQRERGLAVLFVCHDLALVVSAAQRVMVMYLGMVVEVLPGERICEARHPYTRALLDSVLEVEAGASRPIRPLSGEVPSPIDVPSGCPFRTRCPYAEPACSEGRPPLREVEPGHWVACVREGVAGDALPA